MESIIKKLEQGARSPDKANASAATGSPVSPAVIASWKRRDIDGGEEEQKAEDTEPFEYGSGLGTDGSPERFAYRDRDEERKQRAKELNDLRKQTYSHERELANICESRQREDSETPKNSG